MVFLVSASASSLLAVLASHATVRVGCGMAFAASAAQGGEQEEGCHQGAEADDGDGEMG